ncbi:MAG: 3-deoxy-7-phosphoheptulonate synthase [Chloroflexota bacterium]
MRKTHDVHVRSLTPLPPPREYAEKLPLSDSVANHVSRSREQIRNILDGNDDRLLVMVGPCSIHDERAAIEYTERLAELSRRVSDRIMVAMRVYFEKPRTTLGWKGLINDPYLDGSFDISAGMYKAREILLKVNELRMPAATEFLDPFTPQYIADLVSWAAIGARTTESQTHRQMASGLSMPVGFKNGTGGTVQIAVDAIVSAGSPHGFLGIDHDGRACVVNTTGNPHRHLILRGGAMGPNYDANSVAAASGLLAASGMPPHVMIDCSHANCNKDHARQPIVFRDVLRQRVEGNGNIIGIMLESHLFEGNQKLGDDPSELKYGVSITDPCVSWETTEELLLEAHESLAGSVGARAGAAD